MQAARAARRKAKILEAAGDRLAAVSGEARPAEKSKLVLDDDEMDPVLSSRAPPPKAEPSAPTPAPAPSAEVDVLDDALADVFSEVNQVPSFP